MSQKKETTYSAIFMIPIEGITRIMRSFDLFHSKKFFVVPEILNVTTTTKVNKQYFLNMINKSFKHSTDGYNFELSTLKDMLTIEKANFKIAAIIWEDILISHKDVWAVSDGRNELLIGEENYTYLEDYEYLKGVKK